MTLLKFAAATSVAALIAASGASASTVVDLTGSQVSGVGSAFGAFDNGTVSGTIDISATICGFFCSPEITQDATEGLGILRAKYDDPAIDSIISETMTFTFSESVLFKQVDFGFVDLEDDWTIAVDGFTVASESNADPYNFQPGVIGTSLSVTALFSNPPDTKFGPPDDFNVASITVHQLPTNPPPIPLPASAWLLMAGLGGLTLARRRKG